MDEETRNLTEEKERSAEKGKASGSGACGCGKCRRDGAEVSSFGVAYPSLDGIGEDCAALKIVSPAYAGDEGELKAILQYIYQHILLEHMGEKKHAETLKRIAVTEMKHLELLGAMILRLGASPVFSYLPPYPINYFSARAVSCSRLPQKMILDDIAAEQYSIDCYGKMLCRLKNERVAAVVQRIRMDEERHLEELKEILKDLTD